MKNTQGRPTTWTEDEVRELIRMRENAATITEMAEALGRTTGAVSGKLWQLKEQGRIDAENSTKESGDLNPLEKEMAAIIEEQKSEIARLNCQISEMEAEMAVYRERNDQLREENTDLATRATDLKVELTDTKNALAETERQFDEYRRAEEDRAEAVLRLQRELQRMEVEVTRLSCAEERATGIALSVVERFVLGGSVSEIGKGTIRESI